MTHACHISERENGARASAPPAGRTLILGLGNDLLRDDAIGLKLARALARRVPSPGPIDVNETCEMGLSLLDFIVGYDRLVLIDAIQTGQTAPGTLHAFSGDNLDSVPGAAPHFMGVGEVLALGRLLGLHMPGEVNIYAVEVADPFTLDTQMSAPLEEAFPVLIDRISKLMSL